MLLYTPGGGGWIIIINTSPGTTWSRFVFSWRTVTWFMWAWGASGGLFVRVSVAVFMSAPMFPSACRFVTVWHLAAGVTYIVHLPQCEAHVMHLGAPGTPHLQDLSPATQSPLHAPPPLKDGVSLQVHVRLRIRQVRVPVVEQQGVDDVIAGSAACQAVEPLLAASHPYRDLYVRVGIPILLHLHQLIYGSVSTFLDRRWVVWLRVELRAAQRGSGNASVPDPVIRSGSITDKKRTT